MLSIIEVDTMSIATEILSLRHSQDSSVSLLIGALEWARAATGVNSIGREFDAVKAADLVLLNVAVHAAEALNEQPTAKGTRRVALAPKRRSHRSDKGRLTNRIQRRLFAIA